MHGAPWSDSDIGVLVEGRKCGMHMATIAKRLKRTLNATNTRAQMLGLPFHIPKTKCFVPVETEPLPFNQRVRMADLIIGDEGIIICDEADRERLLRKE